MTDTAPRTDSWTVAGRTFNSRLIVGTGKYRDYAQNAAAAEASGAEIVTVAVRRVNLTDPNQPVLTDFLDPKKYTYLPNTAGCFTGEDAVRTLRLAREAGGWTLVKLEVLSNTAHLYPDMIETLRALEDALLEFPGNAFVISHDRWFLDRIATHIIAFEGDSHVEFFQGNYREYEEDKKRRLGDDAGPKRLRFKALK